MKSTSAVPERIISYGGYGSGKTRAWADIADWSRRFGLTSTFRVVNTEPGAIDRLSDAYPDFTSNVEWTDVRDWYTLADASEKYRAASVPGDWIVVEGIDMPWKWIRDLYDEVQAAKRGIVLDESDPFAMIPESDDRAKWDPINAAYQRWIMALIDPARNPAHLYATAPPKAVVLGTGKQGEWKTDDDNVKAFGWRGVYPEGQKFLARHFFSTLHMVQPRHGSWTLTAIDDHGRNEELPIDVPLASFTNDYLRKVARWEFDAQELTALLTARTS